MTTLRDVAMQSGVSVATASRALSDHQYVRDSTRARVKAAAQELGYMPDRAASRLRRSRTSTVGLVLPEMRMSSFASEAAAHLQHQLQEQGYGVVIYATNNDRETELTCLERLRDQGVAGVLHVPLMPAEPLLQGPEPTPVVELFRSTSPTKIDAVVYDAEAAAASLMAHLLSLGHRRVAVTTGLKRLTSVKRRLAGIFSAVQEAGLSSDIVHVVHTPYEPGLAAARVQRLLEEHTEITAVLSTSTQLMLGTLLAARRLGLDIPTDLSLASFGDPEWNLVLPMPITTYSLPLREMSMTAALMLVNRIESNERASHRATQIEFAGRLDVRASTAPPRPG